MLQGAQDVAHEVTSICVSAGVGEIKYLKGMVKRGVPPR